MFEIIDLPSIPDLATTDMMPGPAAVEFTDIRFAYRSAEIEVPESLLPQSGTEQAPSVQVLEGTSFRIEAGQVAGLVGPSGSGKSTIAALLAAQCHPDEGVVAIGGVDLRDLGPEASDRVAYVSQDSHLFNDSVAANLRYARPEATDDELWAVLKQARIADLVESLPDGLETVAGEADYRFSGGERQRLAIVRMLLRPSAIVILDEATAHMDAASEAEVQAAVAEALSGRTALVIAHRLSTVIRADIIFVLDDGVIVEQGTHAELLAENGRYAQLYRIQLDGGTGP